MRCVRLTMVDNKRSGFLADQQEQCPLRRFFQQFQKLVGTLRIHFFRKPDNHDLPSSPTGFQRKLALNLIAFTHINLRLKIVRAQHAHPFVRRQIGILHEGFPPLRQEVIAHGITSGLLLHDGKYEMHVRMHQPVHLYAGRTSAAGFHLIRMFTTKIAGQSQSHRQFSASGRTGEQQGMRSPAVAHVLTQPLLNRILTYNITKSKHVYRSLKLVSIPFIIRKWLLPRL